jgi:hypothetical protein
MNNVARKPSYSSANKSSSAQKSKGPGAPYNLVFSVGDELTKLTGLFQNESKSGKKYLGVKKISQKDAQTLVELINNAAEGTEIGIFVFENTPKA